MKFEFVVSVKLTFLSSKETLSLSAAFSLLVPCALSSRLVSLDDDINSSLISRPTLYEG